MRRIPIAIFVVSAALAAAGCGGGSSSGSSTTGSSSSTESSSGSAATEAAKPKPSKSKPEGSGIVLERPEIEKPKGPPPSHLVSKEIVPGAVAAAKPGDEVTVQYVGADYKSGKEFEASWDTEEPLTFTVGSGEVIAGWEQGVVGMKENGRRELIIPPSLAYGSEGRPPQIPPNETLIFLIDLVSINN